MGEIYGTMCNHATLLSKRFAAFAARMRRERRVQRVELFALHDFQPTKDQRNQLTFSVDDVFLLRSDADEKWWLVKHVLTGKKGYVPMSFVARMNEKEHLEWYDMRITREEAQRILAKEEYEAGAFIIRPKEDRHFTDALAMTVKTMKDNEIKFLHFIINREEGLFSIERGKNFPSITQLVHYYAGHHNRLKQQSLTFSVKKSMAIEVWEIDLSDLEYDEKSPIGNGHFGFVYKGTLSGRAVAVKSVINGMMTVAEFMKEAEIARVFSHKNIVKTLGVCSSKPFIITEFLPNGNLQKYLKKTQLKSADYIKIALKIACAMEHLESRGIVHRDLAARNILVGETHEIIKLADFGLARCLDDSEYYKTDSKTFPYRWTAPEAFVIEGDSVNETKMGKSTSASDVWSFAVVMWELYNKGGNPYEDFPGAMIIYKKLMKDNYRLLCPTACPPVIYNKMLECWLLEPADRPTFAELYQFLLDPYATAQLAASSGRGSTTLSEGTESDSPSGRYEEPSGVEIETEAM